MRRFQVLVVGSGFAGSLISIIARRLGFSTALIERGKHPRFAIGESSTPLANLLLEEICSEYDLPEIAPLCKWGTWQRSRPKIACGLKRGFTFYHHTLGQPFETGPERNRQLLVGASPCEQIADTHWYRSEVDHFLAQQAQAAGVEYWDETDLTSLESRTETIELSGRHAGKRINFTTNFLIDATGPRGFLHQRLNLPEKPLPGLSQTQALFSHFADVAPLPACFGTDGRMPPYPPEQAAVHHLFDGGWIWVLKFNNGITSAGAALTDRIAGSLDCRKGEQAWHDLLRQLPSLAESFGSARNVAPYVWQPRLAFRSGQIVGKNWAMLPSAAAVIDPLLSTGFPLALFGIVRLGRILKEHWGRPSFTKSLNDYSLITNLEIDAAAKLVGALYSSMGRFERFKDLSLLYFVAASFSEMARRLGKPNLADHFLLCGHPEFAKLLNECGVTFALSDGDWTEFKRRLCDQLRDFDVAGLTDSSRDPWYPALPEDLLANGRKLDASRDEISSMLMRCGLQLSDGALL